MFEIFIGSTLSAMATGIGALPILFMRGMISHRGRDVILAFTAGVMMAAAMLGLVPEAIQSGNYIILIIGIYLGVITLTLLEYSIPHVHLEHQHKGGGLDQKSLLIISAITLHNIPEGLSVGVSYASDVWQTGNMIALAIGLQNAPEGLLIALFLVNQSIPRMKAFTIATLTGSIEIAAALIGYSLTSYLAFLIPYGLAFAAGAMLFIIYKELIPESHGDGNETLATYSFIIGLLFMVWLL